MAEEPLLKGAYDLHVHVAPDVIQRVCGLNDLARGASDAGMAGILLKDHCTSTVGRASALNGSSGGGCRFFSAVALNPPVGGLNPTAVEAALRAGVDVVFFPTYGAAHHIRVWGAGKPPTAFPLPKRGFEGVSLLREDGTLIETCEEILALLVRHQAVLATGHVSPEESLALLRQARSMGVRRMLATHVSESVTPFTAAQQREAADLGAFLEHSFFAVTPSCPNATTIEEISRQIREVGVEKVVLSSDFGQVANGDPVKGFGGCLGRIKDLGFSTDDIRRMVCENPKRLLES